MENKLISVVMATYNCAGTIENTLKSIIKQDYGNKKIIIIDGGSTDGTVDIIERYKEHISYFVSEKDEGIYDAYNKGLAKAKGEFVFQIDGDNWLLNESVLSHGIEMLGDDYDIYTAGCLVENPGGYKLSFPNHDLSELYYTTSIVNPTTIMRREVLERNGFYDKNYICAGDHEFLLRMHHAKEKFFIEDKLILFFAYGGVSSNPLKAAFKEDREISIRYGVNKISAHLVCLKRSARFMMILLLRKIGLYNFVKKFMMGKGDLSYKELCEQGIDVKNYWFDN